MPILIREGRKLGYEGKHRNDEGSSLTGTYAEVRFLEGVLDVT